MKLDIVKLHQLIDQWAAEQRDAQEPSTDKPVEAEVIPTRTLPKGQRVIRTKSSGDRVYLLDDIKKTRAWVTTPEILKGLGFEIGDVVEVDDNELLRYQMSAAIYKLPDAKT